MANRKQRQAIAAETISILEREIYSIDCNSVNLSEMLLAMREGTVLYSPSEIKLLLETLGSDSNYKTNRETVHKVVNCTTFAAANSLIHDGFVNPLCLNFASAKNPGGGFLSGSQAQEECLARGSGLYQSLTQQMKYYEVNRSEKSALYTNHIIYSPNVPVFRNDNDRLLDEPYLISIVTSPAVNAGAVRKNELHNINLIQTTMEHRIRSVLAVARKHNHNSLVLGAWGCGVFANNPNNIAKWFYDSLTTDSRFKNKFDRIIFAVLDYAPDTPTYNAFCNAIPISGR